MLFTAEALATLVDLRDYSTGQHGREVALPAAGIAYPLGCGADTARAVELAGRLHDIGKVVVPDAVLRKPGPLTDDEWALMRHHPVVGAQVTSYVPALRPIAPLVRARHERWDGGGYPDGLAGEAIPLGARIIAVVDAFTALTTDRPYRRGCDILTALVELQRCVGTQFDRRVVEALSCVIAPSESRPLAHSIG